ncbi:MULTISPECIES: BrnT family toxin [unclassified Campylobacter]|uniref:BrnT family toxin n=1 Tax=unclassified Campylobacter TaxID=2593542 RepID=UPI0022E9B31D|nr:MULTISPECIES: BrnT family toxin [unclassified Campylobacter]MDA3063101.1 BrnT family toxin [Campylobacter sp. JMF_14 EL1]MDA3074167.1 BrnT family toxin [Campylobacter sp. JMF_10 EL2]
MTYEWDEVKARLNIAKHGVSFDEAKSVFGDERGLVIFDEDHSEDEERFLLLGVSLKERILLVVHCYKQGDIIRIISARKATKNEQRQYKEQL